MIKKISISDVLSANNWPSMKTEYEAESSIKGFPPCKPNFELYQKLETVGSLTIFGAYEEDLLVGFISILYTPATHYDIPLCVTESVFVSEEYRSTGAGLRLLREAEKFAKEKGAAGLLVSAPFGGKLAAVLDMMDYKETNRVFFKRCV